MYYTGFKFLSTLCRRSNNSIPISKRYSSCITEYLSKGSLSSGKSNYAITAFLESAKRTIMTDSTAGFRLALVQLSVGSDKNKNLENASKLIEEAAQGGAKIIGLPECFNSPYGIQYFAEYAEKIPNGETCTFISSLAKQLNVYIIAGSIPELGEDSKLYNTCTVYDPSGDLIGKHRKVHLFDIDVPGKITFQESKVLSPGNDLTIVNTNLCKIGLGICYDIRFPEMAQIYRQLGCELLVYPGAFNMTTGPAHWELLQRSRAVDNQVFVATISPARDETASYTAWGHSMVVNPWGKVMVEAEDSQTVIYADIDLSYAQEVRKQIPVSFQKRNDMYQVECKVPPKP